MQAVIEKKTFSDLKFVRITDPALFAVIPRKLFEQIDEINDESIDTIYQNAKNIMMAPVLNDKGEVIRYLPKQNVWIAIIHDIAHQIKGFIWASFDVIEKCIYVQGYAIDEEYQSNNGTAIKCGVEYLLSLPVPDEIKSSIRMATIKPKAFEKNGWTRSKKVLMEFKNEPKETSE